VVEQEENQGKQLSMIPWPSLTWLDLVISMGIYVYSKCLIIALSVLFTCHDFPCFRSQVLVTCSSN
jgi:hypothetical protein